MDEVTKVFTQIPEFLEYLGTGCAEAIANTATPDKLDLSPKFPFLCSKHYADLIKKASEPEALLREILPTRDELANVPGFVDELPLLFPQELSLPEQSRRGQTGKRLARHA